MKIKRRTLVVFKNWVVRLSIGTIIIGSWYMYFRTETFTINTYDVSGVDVASTAEVVTALEERAKHPAYKVIPRNKILTYGSQSVTDTVRGVIPETAEVRIHPVGFHTLKVTITTLVPLLRVSDTQALNEDGIIFSTRYDIRSYPRITIASSTTKVFKHNGLQFTQLVFSDGTDIKLFLANSTALASKVSSVIFSVTSIALESDGDVTFFDERKMSKVMFLQDADMKKVWSALVSAIDTDPLKTKLETEKDRLLYLDIRFGNKVFYRFSDMSFQNGTVAGILESHATTTGSPPATSTQAGVRH